MTNTLLIAIGSVLMALAGLLPSSKSVKIFKRLNFWAIIIGGSLVITGSINSQSEKSNFERTIAEKTQIIHDLSKKLEEHSDKQISIISGGDGYISVYPIYIDGINPALIALNSSDYPMYDIKMEVSDLDRFKVFEKEKGVFKAINEANKNFKLENLGPHSGTITPYRVDTLYQNLNERTFSINIFARNGKTNERLKFVKVGNKWLNAFEIKRDGKVIYTHVKDGFPKNEDGSIDLK